MKNRVQSIKKSFFISWYEPGDIFLAFKAAEVKKE